MSDALLDPRGLPIAVFLLLALSAAGAAHVWWLRRARSDLMMRPLDGGRRFRGRRIFGDHKRLRGLMMMPLAAGIAFAALGGLRAYLPPWLHRALWDLPVSGYAALGIAAGAAFMLAELPNSFLKRQLGVAPGELPAKGPARLALAVLDRCDSALGVLIAVSVLVPVPAATWFWLLLIGPLVHGLFSTLLYRLGVKARAL